MLSKQEKIEGGVPFPCPLYPQQSDPPNSRRVGNLSPVQFEPHLYKARWTKFVTEIERKPKTLEDLKLAVIEDDTVEYDEDNDLDALEICALDSEDSED